MQFYLRTRSVPRFDENVTVHTEPKERTASPMTTKTVNSHTLDIPLRRPTWREDR